MTGFDEFGLDADVLKGLAALKFEKPTAIQQEALPIILEGKDMMGLAKTGSGKTATCAIPACHKIDTTLPHIQVLVIVPTRELALQYTLEAHNVGKYKNVKVFSVYGGQEASLQKSKLKHGVHFLIATPGRLIDFIYSRDIDLSHVEMLVLDEADEMLSMGFFDDLEFIIHCLTHEHQTLLFSATMPAAIQSISKQYMNNPVEISLVGEDTAPLKIDHHFHYCEHFERNAALVKLLKKFAPKQTMIFCHTRRQCEQVADLLRKDFRAVEYLHAGMGQDIRNRVTDRFRSGRIQYLVATDLAARGLDFSGVTHVFIYQLSDDADIYVHRSGRTGRAEREGSAVTLVTKREIGVLSRILQKIKKDPIWIGPPPPVGQSRSRSRRRAPRRR